MNMKYLSIILLIILLFVNNSVAQNGEKIIAKIGNKSISEREFISRIEFTPLPNRQAKNFHDELKTRFLYTLIAEKLLSLEAEFLGLDKEEIIAGTLDLFLKMFARDELYKIEVKNKSQYYSDSLLTVYLSNATSILINVYSFRSYDQAELFSKSPLDKNNTGASNLITRGQTDTEYEDLLFNLKTGEYTTPIAAKDSFYLFQVVKKYFPIVTKTEGWENEYKRVEKAAAERGEKLRNDIYRKSILAQKKAEANAVLLKKLAQEINTLLEQSKDDKNTVHALSIIQLTKLEQQLTADANSVIIVIGNRKITVKEFLRFFRIETFFVNTVSYKSILSVLNSKTKKYIEYELFSEEAFKRGLQLTEDVKNNFLMWKENYQYNIMQSLLMDSISVTDEEINREFINRTKSKNPVTLVNIIEVLTNDLQIAEKVLNETSSVIDFHELAEKYSERASTKDKRGESGLFPAAKFGEVGRIAETMEIGDVYGPLKIEEGYLIFKLIEKIEKQDTLTVLSEAKKKSIETEIKFRKMRENLSEYTAGLAAKFGISINNEALEKITISTINSVVYKHMGFGGRILAVPLISINDDWVEQWKQKLNQ